MKKFSDTEIQYIQDRACERIGEILDALGVEYFERSDYFQGKCPAHSGDNHRSFYFATRTNHWKCNTKQCHKNPISGNSTSIFGLIRGAMSNKLDRKFTFSESVVFAATILNLSDLKMNEETAENIEIFKIIKQYKAKKIKKANGLTPLFEVIPSLVKDTTYYPARGVDTNIIDRYHISSCNKKNKLFFQRSFFPVLDSSGKYVVGWSGRSIWDKCVLCKMFHDPTTDCPLKHKYLFHEKWLHSKGFKKELHLYNYWFAKYNISKTGTAIVCESPGNVWAYEMAGIKNSVALMGSSMSKEQRILLQKAGALTLILVMDNDKTGKEATETLMEELNYYFRIIPVNIENVNDIAELDNNDIKEQIGRILKDNTKEFILKDN